jgi:FkbM family methyltransferase
VKEYRERRLASWDLELYQAHVRSGDLVFDIGANRGDKVETFLRCGARVIAVEPDGTMAESIRTRFRGDDRCHVVEAGAGGCEGVADFHASQYSTRSTFAVDRMLTLNDGVPYGQGTPVRLTTLDSLIHTYGIPSFCKIDVEGYEPEALSGLSQPVPALSFEFHGELLDDAATCVEHLDSIGMSQFNMVLHPIAGESHQPLNRLFLQNNLAKAELLAKVRALTGQYRLAGDIWAFRA